MLTSIASVTISGDLPEKLSAIAAAGFDGIETIKIAERRCRHVGCGAVNARFRAAALRRILTVKHGSD